MENKIVKLKELLPQFADELTMLLNKENQPQLANQIGKLGIKNRCKCSEDFCSTFYTSSLSNDSQEYSRDCIELNPDNGMIVIGIINENIV